MRPKRGIPMYRPWFFRNKSTQQVILPAVQPCIAQQQTLHLFEMFAVLGRNLMARALVYRGTNVNCPSLRVVLLLVRSVVS